MMTKFGAAVVMLLAAVYADAPRAEACSGTPYCTGTWVFPVGSELQSDRFALTFYSGAVASDGGVPLPRLTRIDDGGVVDVPYETVPLENRRIKLTPREVQPVGATLRLESAQLTQCSADVPLHEEYRLVAPQPLPSSLGTLRANVHSVPLPLGTTPDRSCYAYVDATVADLSVQLDATAAPFASQLVYGLFVDGRKLDSYEQFAHPQAKPWNLKNGHARVYAVCRGSSSFPQHLGLGKHSVRMEATLGTSTLSTPEIEIELRCESASSPPDAGPLVVDASARAPSVDASESSSAVDAGASASSDDLDAVEQLADEGGCRLASARSFDGVVLLLVFALYLRRRRALAAS